MTASSGACRSRRSPEVAVRRKTGILAAVAGEGNGDERLDPEPRLLHRVLPFRSRRPIGLQDASASTALRAMVITRSDFTILLAGPLEAAPSVDHSSKLV